MLRGASETVRNMALIILTENGKTMATYDGEKIIPQQVVYARNGVNKGGNDWGKWGEVSGYPVFDAAARDGKIVWIAGKDNKLHPATVQQVGTKGSSLGDGDYRNIYHVRYIDSYGGEGIDEFSGDHKSGHVAQAW